MTSSEVAIDQPCSTGRLVSFVDRCHDEPERLPARQYADRKPRRSVAD
jgi:hypothetical protein